MPYDPLFTRTTPIPENNSFMTPFFLLCSCFHTLPTNTTSQNIGGTDAWAVPTSNFGGPSPQLPLGLRPWIELQKSSLNILAVSSSYQASRISRRPFRQVLSQTGEAELYGRLRRSRTFYTRHPVVLD